MNMEEEIFEKEEDYVKKKTNDNMCIYFIQKSNVIRSIIQKSTNIAEKKTESQDRFRC